MSGVLLLVIYICVCACYSMKWLLVVISSRFLNLHKFWKLVLHSNLYHNHTVSVIVPLVFIVVLYCFSFDSVVPCFICCSLYFFMLNVLFLSLLPASSSASSSVQFLNHSSIYITLLLRYIVEWYCLCCIRYKYKSC